MCEHMQYSLVQSYACMCVCVPVTISPSWLVLLIHKCFAGCGSWRRACMRVVVRACTCKVDVQALTKMPLVFCDPVCLFLKQQKCCRFPLSACKPIHMYTLTYCTLFVNTTHTHSGTIALAQQARETNQVLYP